MSKRVLRAASLGIVGLAGILLITFTVNQRGALANPPAGGGVLMGDMNQDGVANTDDVGPFVQAMLEPAAWQAEYGLTASEMLALADFDGDGHITVADRIGFCQAIAPVGDFGTGSTGGALLSGGAVDLDIDSDNNNDTDPPLRSDEEDLLEDDPYEPGKWIEVGAAARTPAVLEFDATGAVPLT